MRDITTSLVFIIESDAPVIKNGRFRRSMKKKTPTFPAWTRQRLAEWSSQWGLAGLEARVTLQFSSRMTRSLGRCYTERGLIRLSERLLEGPPSLLEEALCHELAHAAVHELNGKRCRPHGPEWKNLMRAAGYEPRVRFPAGTLPQPARRPKRRRRYLYIHRCPVCQAEHIARRAVRRWRCAACVEAGLDGGLEIWRRALRSTRAR